MDVLLAGVWWEEDVGIDLAKYVHQNSNMIFQGIYLHCGDTYHTESVAQVCELRDKAITCCDTFRKRLVDAGVPCPISGTGSTPSCSQPSDTMKTLTEIHPGNYIFYGNNFIILAFHRLKLSVDILVSRSAIF